MAGDDEARLGRCQFAVKKAGAGRERQADRFGVALDQFAAVLAGREQRRDRVRQLALEVAVTVDRQLRQPGAEMRVAGQAREAAVGQRQVEAAGVEPGLPGRQRHAQRPGSARGKAELAQQGDDAGQALTGDDADRTACIRARLGRRKEQLFGCLEQVVLECAGDHLRTARACRLRQKGALAGTLAAAEQDYAGMAGRIAGGFADARPVGRFAVALADDAAAPVAQQPTAVAALLRPVGRNEQDQGGHRRLCQ